MTELRDYNFGDSIEDIAVTESLKNMYSRTGSCELNLEENDLVVYDGQLNSQMSTVLMIDISHSMIFAIWITASYETKITHKFH